MLICPKCNIELDKNGTVLGVFWVCPSCKGRAIAVDVIRKAVPKGVVDKLWQTARTGGYPQKRQCPSCRAMMSEVSIDIDKDKTEYIDVCTNCFFIWFDQGEYEGLPKVPLTKADADKLPAEARLILGRAQVSLYNEKKEMERQEKEVMDSIAAAIRNPAILPFMIIRIIFGLSMTVYKCFKDERFDEDVPYDECGKLR